MKKDIQRTATEWLDFYYGCHLSPVYLHPVKIKTNNKRIFSKKYYQK